MVGIWWIGVTAGTTGAVVNGVCAAGLENVWGEIEGIWESVEVDTDSADGCSSTVAVLSVEDDVGGDVLLRSAVLEVVDGCSSTVAVVSVEDNVGGDVLLRSAVVDGVCRAGGCSSGVAVVSAEDDVDGAGGCVVGISKAKLVPGGSSLQPIATRRSLENSTRRFRCDGVMA